MCHHFGLAIREELAETETEEETDGPAEEMDTPEMEEPEMEEPELERPEIADD